MKKILSILLTLLIISFSCISVSAETHNHSGWTGVSTLSNDMATGNYYLTDDVYLGGSSWTIASGKEINLCLNGHYIYTTQYIGTAYMIDVLGKLTITDCAATAGGVKSIHSAGMIQVNGGELIINKGNFIHTRHNAHMVHAYNGGKVTINGGKFTNEESELSSLSNLYGFFVAKGKNGTKNSEININDGEFVLQTINNTVVPITQAAFTPYLVNTDTDGKINITGGTFNAVHYGFSKYSYDNVTITGGTFNTNSFEMSSGVGHTLSLTNIIGGDYRLKTVAGGYEVEKIEAYKIGKKTYSSLTKALNKVETNETIVVLENSYLNDTYTIDKKITLNLNGFTLTMNKEANQVFDIVSGGKLTIKDSSNNQNGTITSNNKCPTLINVTEGELVINSGIFKIQENRYKSYTHVINCKQGKVTLNGGTYNLLIGKYDTEDNLYSSVVAATRTVNTDISIVNINGGTYNASEDTSGTFKFSSRIFTPYKGDNYDFGTINVNGGYFNGSYINPELTIDGYLNITGGSFDRNEFVNNSIPYYIELADLIDNEKYHIVESGSPTRYIVTAIAKPTSNINYSVVKTSVK